MPLVLIQCEDFNPGALLAALQANAPHAGALANFIGIVRSTPQAPLVSMTLEHYPAMTQAAITRIAEQAEQRFSLSACTVVHRHGTLLAGERIVFVGTAAPHRRAALQATEFLIDWLKTRAPFWKQEHFASGETSWVAALEEDTHAADRWGETT